MPATQMNSDELKKLSLEELYQKLSSGPKGLVTKEAINRAKIFGYNQIGVKRKVNLFIKFISYFKNPLILVLIAAALVSGLTGQIKNMVIILTMVFLSVVLNFFQEHKSGKAAEKIAKRLAIKAKILRDGKEKELETKYIVPGDIVLLSAGDIVPADGKIIGADDFFLNEASLTGESLPIEKFADRDNIIFSGTNVISGYGRFLVSNTGLETEFGKIAENIARPELQNAFEKGINKFGFLIIQVIAVIVSIIFLINAFTGKGFFNSFLFALAVAVGVTPELLPMIMSVNMAKGAMKMEKNGVLVKRLNSIPSFGSIDILCTDKTGTLTQDKITVIKHVDIFGSDSASVFFSAYLNGYFETGIRNILDEAILAHEELNLNEYKKIEEIPYDFNRKRSSIFAEHHDGIIMVTKGAPEEIFKICSSYFKGDDIKPLDAEALNEAKKIYNDLSGKGFRLLGIAEKKIGTKKNKYEIGEEAEMTLRGFMVFYDPPKLDVKETLNFMKDHGIEIKILTGDGQLITEKICSDIGLPIKEIITGNELDLNVLSDEEIYKKIKNATICARMSPSQKEKIISELKRHGATIGYLGDGINDAPSLKTADVGISVDNAVDVAKDTADIILMKKGLKELMKGVIEGRKTFGNTMKYLLMGLSSNFGNMFSMIGASLFLPFFPMTASQILLNNFIYDASQLSIPSDNVDVEYLRKPKHWNMGYIKKYMVIFGSISSIFDFITFYILFGVLHFNAPTFQAGWFVESLATQIFVIYIIRTRKIPFLESRPSKYLMYTTLGAVALGIILTAEGIGKFFGFSPLPLFVFLITLAIVIAYLATMEIIKHIFYKHLKNEAEV